MIKRTAIPDLGRLTDHDTHAMINEKTSADTRPGVNLDPSQPARDHGKKARQPTQAMPPQPVITPMHDDCMDTGVTGQHLKCITSSGIALHDATDVLSQPGEHKPVLETVALKAISGTNSAAHDNLFNSKFIQTAWMTSKPSS